MGAVPFEEEPLSIWFRGRFSREGMGYTTLRGTEANRAQIGLISSNSPTLYHIRDFQQGREWSEFVLLGRNKAPLLSATSLAGKKGPLSEECMTFARHRRLYRTFTETKWCGCRGHCEKQEQETEKSCKKWGGQTQKYRREVVEMKIAGGMGPVEGVMFFLHKETC